MTLDDDDDDDSWCVTCEKCGECVFGTSASRARDALTIHSRACFQRPRANETPTTTRAVYRRACTVCDDFEIATDDKMTFWSAWEAHKRTTAHEEGMRRKAEAKAARRDARDGTRDGTHGESATGKPGATMERRCAECGDVIKGSSAANLENNLKQHARGRRHREATERKKTERARERSEEIRRAFEAVREMKEKVTVGNAFDALEIGSNASSRSGSPARVAATSRLREEREEMLDALTRVLRREGASAAGAVLHGIGSDARAGACVGRRAETRNDGGSRDVRVRVDEPFCAIVCGAPGSGVSHTCAVLAESCLVRCPRPVERPVNALERKMMALTFHVGAPGASYKNAELLGLVRHASAIKEALANDDDASYDGVERVVFMVSPFSSKAREEALLDASLWAGTSVAVDVAHFAADVDNENSLILPPDVVDHAKPGTLFVVDLTEPRLSDDEVSDAFCDVLAWFRSMEFAPGEDVRKLIVLDEAHRYLKTTGAESKLATELVNTARMMRRYDVRLVVGAQTPFALPEELLDVASVYFVHQCASLRWQERLVRSGFIPHPECAVRDLGVGEAIVSSARTIGARAPKSYRIRVRNRLTGAP